MDYKISIVDLLKVDHQVLNKKNSDFAIYSGISDYDIPLGTIFNTLFDSKSVDKKINGEFKIENIIIFNRESSCVLKDYHAIIFISSNIKLKQIISYMNMNDKGNFINICHLTIKSNSNDL